MNCCCIALCAFSFSSFAIYVLNDICDRRKDRLHETKCKRPIASGDISVRKAVVIFVILVIAAFLCELIIFSAKNFALLICYVVLNIGYSFGLKKIALLDVAILVSGFFLRILYGATVTNIYVSNWLYLTVMAAAFYFAFGKRRGELQKTDLSKSSRSVLSSYTYNFLDKEMYLCMALLNVFYALWSVDEKHAGLANYKMYVWTVPVVLLISMKYSLNMERGSDGDPIEVLLHDKSLIFLCVLYVAMIFYILYF